MMSNHARHCLVDSGQSFEEVDVTIKCGLCGICGLVASNFEESFPSSRRYLLPPIICRSSEKFSSEKPVHFCLRFEFASRLLVAGWCSPKAIPLKTFFSQKTLLMPVVDHKWPQIRY